MACITRKNDDLLNKYYKYNQREIIAYIICGVCFFFWTLYVIFIHIFNPIKQVGTHVYRLANYLRNNGCSVHVNDMVYFSNPDTAVQLLGTPSKTPVFTALGNSAKEICDYILENDKR